MANKVLHVHDSLLGHVPRAGIIGATTGNAPVTIDSDGLRITGERLPSSDGPILAVGDSYTFGEDVGDTDAWPAQLQRLIGRRVLNGGVSGYGFDQIVLRTEQLTAVHRPPIVIVSFIADDIWRTEMRRMWGYNKPWFAIEDGLLVLKGVPVPDRKGLPLHVRLRIERVLSRVPWILQQLLGHHVRIHSSGVGQAIVHRLTERLAGLQAERRAKVIMMAQYDPRAWIRGTIASEQRRLTQAVLKSAANNGLAILDTFQRLAVEPKSHDFYGTVHMNARGNLMIASLLAATLPTLLKNST